VRASLKDLKPSLIRQIHALKKPTSLDVSLGEPSLRVDDELWQRGLARFSKEPQGYTHNLGLPALRARIAAHHRLPDRSATEHVIVTVGSEEALFLAFFTLLDVGDEVIVLDPAYPAYAGLAMLTGATLIRVPPP
jgi:aminotransferase